MSFRLNAIVDVMKPKKEMSTLKILMEIWLMQNTVFIAKNVEHILDIFLMDIGIIKINCKRNYR